MSDRRTPGSSGSPGSPGSARKLVTRVMLFLLLVTGGAIVNIVVAWACALWAKADVSWAFDEPELAEAKWELVREKMLDAHGPMLEPNAFDNVQSCWEKHGLGVERAYLTSVWLLHDPADVTHDRRNTIAESTAGLPCRALCGAQVQTNESHVVGSAYRRLPHTESNSFRWAVSLHPSKMIHADNHAPLLPLCPLWPGFAINTLFYAAILWLLFAAPFVLRRHLRLKRGLCPACAYPVGTSPVCTECGKPVKARSVEPASS